MSDSALDRWEQDFRAAARADDHARLREHLERLELPDEPRRLLEGTVALVRACSSYMEMDDREDDFESFLRVQSYHPEAAPDARYVFTFDLHGKAFARVLVETKVQTLDLADLYGHPWWDYQVVGFGRLWISHPDWSKLTDEEVLQLDEEVTNDLRFDYTEEEINFWFNQSLDGASLFVCVQDVHEDEDEGDG
jgi:hypothetical protein